MLIEFSVKNYRSFRRRNNSFYGSNQVKHTKERPYSIWRNAYFAKRCHLWKKRWRKK